MNWMQSNVYSHSYLRISLPTNWKPYCSPARVICFSGHKLLNCGFKILLFWVHNIKHYLGVWLQKTFSAIKIRRIANAVHHRLNVIVVMCICITSFNIIVHSPVIKKRVHASSQSSSTKISSSVGHRVASPCLLPLICWLCFHHCQCNLHPSHIHVIRPLSTGLWVTAHEY
jgi:hypothetical protein